MHSKPIAKLTAKIAPVLYALTKTRLRTTASFLVIIFVSLILYYLPVLTRHADYFISDHSLFFEPLTGYLKERLRSGQMPMWNPYNQCGMTEIGNPSPNSLYPPYLIFACLPYSQALAVIMLLNHLIAALGGILLVVSLGWEIWAAVICGLTFAFSGYMFSLLCNFTLVAVAAWVPMVLWSFRQIRLSLDANGKGLRMAFCLSVFSMTMMALAGRPEILVPAGALNCCAIAFDTILRARQGRPIVKILIWQGAATAVAILLTMPLYFPMLEWVSFSRRRSGLDLSEILSFSAHWYDFFIVAFGQAAGNIQVIGSPLLPILGSGRIWPFLPSSFVGTIAITLATWGFSDKGWRWRWPVLAVLILTVVLCLGKNCPIAVWLVTNIQLLSVFRYPIKWMVFLALMIAIAAARGLYSMNRKDVSGSGQIIAVIVWSVAALIGVILVQLNFLHINICEPREQWLSLQSVLGLSVIFRAMLGLGVCLLGQSVVTEMISVPTASLAIIAALFIDLLGTGVSCRQQMAACGFYERKSAVCDILRSFNISRNERFFPLYPGPLWPPGIPLEPLQRTEAYAEYGRTLMSGNANIDYHVLETSGYEAAAAADFSNLCQATIVRSLSFLPDNANDKLFKEQATTDLPLYRLCQSTATFFVASNIAKGTRPVAILDRNLFRLVKEDKSINLRVYRTLKPLPRAYLSSYWSWQQNRFSAYLEMMNAEKSDYNPALITWIYPSYVGLYEQPIGSRPMPAPPLNESNLPETRKSQLNKSDATKSDLANSVQTDSSLAKSGLTHSEFTSSNRPDFERDEIIDSKPVKFLVDQPEHVALSYSVDRPCWLVLADQFYPGWQAQVDGIDCPIFRANADVRAVFVPAGSHTVSFDYKPVSFLIGLYLAAAGFLVWFICLALMSMAARKRKQKPRRRK